MSEKPLMDPGSNVRLIGFRSTGGPKDHGNTWFEQALGILGNNEAIQTPPRFYGDNESGDALFDLLSALDPNKDRIVEAADLENLALIVSGYGCGGTTAVNFTRTISEADDVSVGGNVKGRLDYRLAAPIPVLLLLTYDVDPFREEPGTVQKNVAVLWNFFQTRGGDTVFRPMDAGRSPVTVGTPASRRVRGLRLESQASKVSLQIDSSHLYAEKTGFPFGSNFAEYQLSSSDCGHDGVAYLPDFTSAIARLMGMRNRVDPVMQVK